MIRERRSPAAGRAEKLWPESADSQDERPFPERTRTRLSPCPEIDCVRHRLSPGILAAAELRAAEIGTGADDVLAASATISEENYAHDLARSLHVAFEPLEHVRREQIPLDDNRLMQAAAVGMLPVLSGVDPTLIVTRRGPPVRRLIAAIRRTPALAHHIRITTPERMTAFVQRHSDAALKYRCARQLRNEHPDYCAGARANRRFAAIGFGLASIAGALWLNAKLVLIATDIALALIFMCWTALRLFGALTTELIWRRRAELRDHELPVYSVVVALYREAKSVLELIHALAELDYPKEKLDIKFAIEPDDDETRLAIMTAGFSHPFEIITAPAIGPRTKPKALNAALTFARGSLLAVYDAEDRPEPDQLRIAAETFASHGQELACVQARLTVDNTGDSWIARMFTAEYAGLFDVFLPGLAAWRLPLPLGGSSNHFRIQALRNAGAWDPYNVTEDADLGMRLARFGYYTTVIPSSTYEEAPSRFGPWLRQRTRWFKGWMQTWFVHMRRPLRLAQDLGAAGFLVFQLVVGGTVLASLVHLIFALTLAWQLATASGLLHEKSTADLIISGLHGTTLVAGYAISGFLGLIGLARRGLLRCGWALLLMPLYWLLLSIAAWRALIQLVVAPYRWEKTEHGLARSSRFAQRRR